MYLAEKLRVFQIHLIITSFGVPFMWQAYGDAVGFSDFLGFEFQSGQGSSGSLFDIEACQVQC